MKIASIDKTIFNTIIDVRIYDINYGNHLGHDSLISFFHEARVRLFKKAGFTELNIQGLSILVKSLAVDYINEAFHADKLMIHIGIGAISKTSIELLYQATNCDTNKAIAKAVTQIVFYDLNKSKVAKIPQDFLSHLA